MRNSLFNVRTCGTTALCVTLLTGSLAAYESSLPNLQTPSTLDPVTLEMGIDHRFGKVIGGERLQSLFDGANTNFDFRLAIWRGLELDFSYWTANHEFGGGIGWTRPIKKLYSRARLDVRFFSFEKVPTTSRVGNVLLIGSFQTRPLLGIFSPTLNAIYDAYNVRPGMGFGIVVSTGTFLDFTGEFSPVVFPHLGEPLDYPAISLGIKINTNGHHFRFLVANTTAIGPRRVLLGARSNEFHFGFSIDRRFRF